MESMFFNKQRGGAINVEYWDDLSIPMTKNITSTLAKADVNVVQIDDTKVKLADWLSTPSSDWKIYTIRLPQRQSQAHRETFKSSKLDQIKGGKIIVIIGGIGSAIGPTGKGKEFTLLTKDDIDDYKKRGIPIFPMIQNGDKLDGQSIENLKQIVSLVSGGAMPLEQATIQQVPTPVPQPVSTAKSVDQNRISDLFIQTYAHKKAPVEMKQREADIASIDKVYIITLQFQLDNYGNPKLPTEEEIRRGAPGSSSHYIKKFYESKGKQVSIVFYYDKPGENKGYRDIIGDGLKGITLNSKLIIIGHCCKYERGDLSILGNSTPGLLSPWLLTNVLVRFDNLVDPEKTNITNALRISIYACQAGRFFCHELSQMLAEKNINAVLKCRPVNVARLGTKFNPLYEYERGGCERFPQLIYTKMISNIDAQQQFVTYKVDYPQDHASQIFPEDPAKQIFE